MRLLSFMRDQLPDRRTRSASLDQSGLLIDPPQGIKFLFPSQFRSMNGGLQHAYCLVVNPKRHRKGMSVFASMRERESRRVGEAVRGSVNNFGDHRQGADGPGSHSGSQEQFRKVGWPAIGCRCKVSV